MGTEFQYIADHALKPEDPDTYPECHVCGNTDIPVYLAQGSILHAEDDDDVYVACKACLQAARIEHVSEWKTDPTIEAYVERYYADQAEAMRTEAAARLKQALRQTPRVPLFLQGDDWPLCCGDLTEFIGTPQVEADLRTLPHDATYWEGFVQPTTMDFEQDGPPESLQEISLFQCLHCKQRYWVFQYT